MNGLRRWAKLEFILYRSYEGQAPPSAKRETTKKSKKAKDKAALPPLPPDAGIRSPKDGTAPAESQRNSARPKEKRQSMKDRIAMFNKGT